VQNGGSAEYIPADPNYLTRVPDGLSAKDAAPIICAVVTTYEGIKKPSQKPGAWIAISGVSGLCQWMLTRQNPGIFGCYVRHPTDDTLDWVHLGHVATWHSRLLKHEQRQFGTGADSP